MIDAIATKAPGFKPRVAMILGSGLGSYADQLENKKAIDYADIPGFVRSTVRATVATRCACVPTSANARPRCWKCMP